MKSINSLMGLLCFIYNLFKSDTKKVVKPTILILSSSFCL